MSPSPEAPHAPEAPDVQVLSPEQAAGAGLRAEDLRLTFADAADGTKLLERWIAAARQRGTFRVGELVLYVVQKSGGDTVECRSALYPQDSVEPHWVPGQVRVVPVTRPVTRSTTSFETRCRMVSHPVQRAETTYSSQYDSFSHSYHSVPSTHYVTSYEMRDECHSEPVTRLETTWECTFEHRYEPPRLEYLAQKKLRESQPICYVASSPQATSRVEGKLYFAN